MGRAGEHADLADIVASRDPADPGHDIAGAPRDLEHPGGDDEQRGLAVSLREHDLALLQLVPDQLGLQALARID